MKHINFQTEHERNKLDFQCHRSQRDIFIAGMFIAVGLLLAVLIG